ncbi:MAG TPA: thioredoxin-like domain-containing protein [Verrucomicrobiae bacterium]|jgi:thiol-disulfide isomerase/thioredoxin|nr:thioredoxin-like domain-containing protein [Verrucomicrobiae bacterium]
MNPISRVVLLGALALTQACLSAIAADNAVLKSHSGDLVALEGDQLVPFKASSTAPYTILYFGAGWCPDCRRFSPSLVKAYDNQDSHNKRFEVLLISRDRDSEGMLKYMRSEKMRWPAVAFNKAKDRDLNRFYSGHGIPCLTLVDQAGHILIQSKDDQDGQEVLARIEQLVKTAPEK